MLKIRELRKAKKLNQQQLANLTGLSVRMIIAYEKPEADIPMKKLQKIADSLEVDISELLHTETGEQSEFVSEPAVAYGTSGLLPLIPLDAMAGFGTSETVVLLQQCEKYLVPAFKGADYLIQVRGNSMEPRYSSGDVVACKIVPTTDAFFQWGKVYVLDTNQGPMLKCIKKGSDAEHILIVSDNSADYDPFELHLSHINALAIVIGVIRLV